MKVIFLDIDGVLNYAEHMEREYKKGHPTSSYYLVLDHDKIELLANLVRTTGAIVVISSSWRIGGFEQAKSIKNLTEQLNQHGIVVYGYTPTSYEGVRGREIAQWIMRNCSNIPQFCIFDDDSDMEDLTDDHLVKTSWQIGLVPDNIEQAREVLNKIPSETVKKYIRNEGVK